MRYYKPPVLNGLGFSRKEVNKARENHRLLSVTLFVGNKCNLRCLYCYRDAGKKEENELTLEERILVLIQARELGAKTVIVPGAGEPLLDPLFYDRKHESFPIINIANSLGMHVVLFTNGTFITKENAKVLAQKDVSVVAKLNSTFCSPGIQDFLAGVKGAHKKIHAGLNALLDAELCKGNRLGIDSVIVKQNYDNIPHIFELCRRNKIIPYITTELHGGRGQENAELLDVSKEKIRELFNKLLGMDRKMFGYSWSPAPPIVAGSCQKLLYDIVVDHHGNIQPCPGINISLGNVRNIPLAEALYTEFMQNVRHPKKYLKGKCGICKRQDCVYGCRLSAFAATGDLMSEDPQCWK